MEKHGHINPEYISILKNTVNIHGGKLPKEYEEFRDILTEYGFLNKDGIVTQAGREAIEKGV